MILDFMVLLLSFLVQTPFFKGLCCNVVMLYIEGVPTASSRMLCTGIGAQPQSRCPVGPTVSANNMFCSQCAKYDWCLLSHSFGW